MNAEQMRLALVAFASLIGGEETSRRANALSRFAALFEGLGTAKVAAIVSNIEHNWKADNRVPRRPSELRQALIDIQKALGHIGAKPQAKAFVTLLQLFRGAGDQPVDAFVAEAIAARTKRSRSRGGASPKKTPLSAEQARDLADQLALASDDRTRFDALLDQLKSELKVAELKAIAGFYTGYETTKTKKDGHCEIHPPLASRRRAKSRS
jgi:hypothetical protein